MMSCMTPRATALAPEDRRRAIVAALVPLIAERGGEVSTREIAQAAGIAEGTIFRAFTDKRELMLAVAEEAMNPADGERTFREAIEGIDDLRAKVVVVAQRIQARMHLTMTVMVATRRYLMAEEGSTTPPRDAKPGPPAFVVAAQNDLNSRLTAMFEAHRDELSVAPEVAATALRSLVFGSGRFDVGLGAVLTPTDIADLLLDGLLRRND
jgi:AcrR family transcriptional regulator